MECRVAVLAGAAASKPETDEGNLLSACSSPVEAGAGAQPGKGRGEKHSDVDRARVREAVNSKFARLRVDLPREMSRMISAGCHRMDRNPSNP